MSDQSMSKTRRTPAPRVLILAAPAGAYVGITQAAEGPVAEAAALGGGIVLAALVGPAVLRSAGKAAASSAARKKVKAKREKGATA